MGSGFAKKKKEARLMQEQFGKLQSEMQNLEVVGAAGSGLVTITLSGDGEMKSIKIKPECVDADDIDGLEILIKAAYTDAQKKLKDRSPPIPGLSGLSGLFG